MSAFIVHDRHINALITFAQKYDVSLYLGGGFGNSRSLYARDRNDAQTLAELLLRENERSVDHRYQETNEVAAIRFTPERRDITPVHILKMCDCYDYQACETNNYRSTDAARFIDNIRSAAIRTFPGYEDGPWELTPEFDERRKVAG